MSAVTIRSAKLEGTTGTTSTVTITAPAPGNTLLVQVSLPAANVAGISFSDNLNGAWPAADFSQSGLFGSKSFYYFRKSNLPNAPTSLSVTGTGSFAATFEVVEVAGLDNTTPFVSSFGKTALAGGTSFSASADTTNANDFVMMGLSTSNARSISSVTNGYAVVGASSTDTQLIYLADASGAGTKSTTITLAASASAYGLGVVYKAAKPAVTSVSSPTATEGGNLVFTVNLASAPTGSAAGYVAALAGSGAHPADPINDLTNTLATATHSNGVTYAAGAYSVPVGVSVFTTTIGAYDDILDEYDETLTLTIDGVVGTGTIVSNDPAPTVTFTDGVESFGVVTCTATLGAVSGKDVSFQVDTTNGTKTAGTNYTAIVAQTVTIPAGSLTAAITVNTL